MLNSECKISGHNVSAYNVYATLPGNPHFCDIVFMHIFSFRNIPKQFLKHRNVPIVHIYSRFKNVIIKKLETGDFTLIRPGGKMYIPSACAAYHPEARRQYQNR